MDHLALLLWSQVGGSSHCFDPSRPSLHPSCQSDPPDLTGPTSHRRTVWTGRSPHRFLSPFKFPRPWDRCDRPHLLNFLAVVLPFCSSLSPCATRHLSVLVLPLIFSFCKSCSPSHCMRPHRGSCRSHTPPGSPFLPPPSHISLRPAPSHLQRFVTAVRKWQRVSTSGACRLQTAGREGVGDRQKRFRWLSHVPFFFDLPCLLAFFSPLRRDLFFLYCASLWVTLYDNLRHVLDMGGKRRDLGIGREGFRRGTVGQTRRWECTKNRIWPHTSLLYDVHIFQ